jgi:ribonuclease HI
MLEVYIDGATLGEDGKSAASFIAKNKQICLEGYTYIGEKTNHEAEFHALYFALSSLKDDYSDEILSIRSDSKIVVDTIEKAYTKNPAFLSYYNKIAELIMHFPHVFIKWIPDKDNKRADTLARTGLQTESTVIQSCS